MNPSRLLWHLSRGRAATRRRWSQGEIDQLERMIGKKSPHEMAEALGRGYNSIVSKLTHMGYTIRQDVLLPALDGLNPHAFAKAHGIPYEMVWKAMRSGQLKARKINRKEYVLDRRAARKYANHMRRITARRARVLARIKEKTITKQAFMRLVGLGETHAWRYLVGGIVKCWKVPCKFTDVGEHRWEWAVSAKDARRVARERRQGTLKLSKPKYRAISKSNSAQVMQLRRERRLGHRQAYGPRNCPIPNSLTVAQVAQRAGVSENQVRAHLKLGRIPHKTYTIGKHEFIAIPTAAMPAYLKWCARIVKATGPMRPHQRQRESVRAAGRLTLTDAAQQYPNIHLGTLRQQVKAGHIPAQKIDGLWAITPAVARRYAAQRKARGK
jgi:AraC-like DNA-binding protein